MANQHKYDVKITFQIVKTGTGFKEVQKELEKTEKVNKKASKSIIGKWTELRSKVLSIQWAIQAVKNSFDLLWKSARGGAELTQLTESFDRANEAIFKTPTLLNDMSLAARGTITEANLMSGIMTLVAGTSEELSKALTSNAAGLLTIAKAANRLNPTLGDTDFFYKSLTTGIKRSSFRILDNLGIIVRVAESNRRWAAEMGRTVASMSAEERQMALLNEVMRVGGRLVDQAGGKSESLTDSYDILKAMLGELANAGKQTLDTMIRPLIQGFADAQLAAIELNAVLAELFNQDNENAVGDYTRALNAAEDAYVEWREQARKDISWLPILMSIDAAAVSKQAKEAADAFASELYEALRETSPEALSALDELVRAGQGDFGLEEYSQLVTDSTNDLNQAFLKLGRTTTANGVIFGNQIITWQQLIDLNSEYVEVQEKASTAAMAANLANTMGRSGYTQSLQAMVRLNEENKTGAALLTALEIETTDQTKALQDYVITTATTADTTADLVRKLEALDYTVTEDTISLGDFSISWDELNKILLKNEKQTQRVTAATAFLTAEEEYLALAGIDVAAGMEIMTVRAEKWGKAVEDAAKEVERLREVELDSFFDQAASGGLNYFNEELEDLGTNLVWVTDSTVMHKDQVDNLQGEYDKILGTINDYNTFAKDATLTDDERAEKVGELNEELTILNDRMIQVGDVQGHYTEIVTAATVNEEKLTEALFNSVVAKSDDTLATALLGVSLGELTELQADAMFKTALLAQGIEDIATAYADGELGINGVREAYENLITTVEETPSLFEEPTKEMEANIGRIEDLYANKDWSFLEDPLDLVIPEPDTSLFDTYMIDNFPEDEKAVDVVISTNADDVVEFELTPVQKLVKEIEEESPYEANLKSNADTEIIPVHNYLLELQKIPHSVTTVVTTKFETEGNPNYNPFPGPGNATGADYIVPPGYSNESWNIGTASSGERVRVDTPAQQSQPGKAPASGPTYQFYGPVYGEDALMQAIDDSYTRKGILASNRARGK